MQTRSDARRRLSRHVADLKRLLQRAERNAADPTLAAAIAALSERMTFDLVNLYALRAAGIDDVLHGVVEPALERARDALRTARVRPASIERTLRAASIALADVA